MTGIWHTRKLNQIAVFKRAHHHGMGEGLITGRVAKAFAIP